MHNQEKGSPQGTAAQQLQHLQQQQQQQQQQQMKSPGSPGSIDLHQPMANKQPQGQLAALLRNRADLEFDMFGLGKDISRSNSAPPTQAYMNNRFDSDEPTPGDPRLDPDYAAYYYVHSRLDPRLPPPLYQPGQSWQVWAGQAAPGKPGSTEKPLERFRGLGGDEDFLAGGAHPLDQSLEPEGKRTDDGEKDSGTGSEYSPNIRIPVFSPELKAPQPQKAPVGGADSHSPKKRNLVDIIQEVCVVVL
ncbi:hypothetical protein BKA69DRAFT_58796 [Paraphysoderma sedebokerense]|nr:hypothetical protein BKA69DRAFT_58796 [Paraphysoderma sedebokerense]